MALKQIGGEIRAQPLNENFQYLDGKLLFGPESNRPNPGVAGRLYVTTDKRIIYEDTGTAWQKVGVVNWNDISGKPSTFTPSVHASTHAAGGSDPITPASIGAAPATHASQHRSGGSDPLTPADIGAVNKSGDTITGNVKIFKDAPRLEFDRPSGAVDGNAGIVILDNGAYQSGKELFYSYQNGSWQVGPNQIWHAGNAGPFYRGAGSPEGVVTAPPGAIYQNTNGGQGTTVYYKASGTGNTGWRAIA